jgi:hypothetical protein
MKPTTFRSLAGLAVLAVVLVATHVGLSAEQIGGAVGLAALVLGELGLRQPQVGGRQ